MKSVYAFGPSLATQGGISSVIRCHMESLEGRICFRHIPTYHGKSRVLDILLFAASVARALAIGVFKGGRRSIAHIHTSTYGSFLRKSILLSVCKLLGFKTILQLHGADFDTFLDEIGSLRAGRIFKKADVVLALSESWLKTIHEHLPELQNLEVLYNPCTPLHARIIRETAPHETVRILFTGRLGKRKGSYDLVSACHKVRAFNFTLDLYGDGDILQTQQLVASYGLESRIRVFPWMEYSKLQTLYSHYHIFVLPSYCEGMPMSLLEAMANGLPAVTTNIKGIKECIKDGINGFLVAPGDIDTLSERLEALILDQELRERMGNSARETAAATFSPDLIAERLLSVYQRLSEIPARAEKKPMVRRKASERQPSI